jgi:quinol monooxygenase YgiN
MYSRATEHVLITHHVADYAAWKAVFDGAAPLRKAAGELEYRMLCDAGDPNLVVHLSAWTSLDAARAFFESPRLVDIRARAGVTAPEFAYLRELDAGVL